MLARAMEADPTFNQVAWKNLTYLRSVRVIRAYPVVTHTHYI